MSLVLTHIAMSELVAQLQRTCCIHFRTLWAFLSYHTTHWMCLCSHLEMSCVCGFMVFNNDCRLYVFVSIWSC